MNGLELTCILSSMNETKYIFKGCFMNDDCNIFMFMHEKNCCFVMNSEQNPHIMGHWLFFSIERGSLFFVDSYGKHPQVYGGMIHHFFSEFKGSKHLIFTKPVQSPHTFVCGLYVIASAYILSKYKNPNRVRNLFSYSNRIKNDRFVKFYVFNITGFMYKNML